MVTFKRLNQCFVKSPGSHVEDCIISLGIYYVSSLVLVPIRWWMEKAMAPHSSTLAWKIPWTEGPGGLQSMGSLRVRHDWATSLSLSCIGEGNGNPLQCSCLENPRDRGVWLADAYGVAQSQTRLRWFSSSRWSTAAPLELPPPHISDWKQCYTYSC